MPILNYTTKISASKTMHEIQTKLSEAGAQAVSIQYSSGIATGVGFTIPTPYGIRSFALPVNIGSVEAILMSTVEPWQRPKGQAERVAWRIVKDWLEAQLALIETEMVTLDQVMLPYMLDATGVTAYELYKNGQLALGSGE